MRIALALQGGGAHGAYTWGVLTRLLRSPRVEIDAVSGASAGAVNAIALLEGLRRGGRKGALERLETIWRAIGGRRQLAQLFGMPVNGIRNHALHHAALRGAAAWTRWMSPEQLNPLDLDPLRDILDAEVDFKALARSKGPAVFVSATDVAQRRARIFSRRELSRDVIMASACLPLIHRGISIDGQLYWDGGLTANPPLWSLTGATRAERLVLVRLGAKVADAGPSSTEEIRAELTELSFESPLNAELDSIRQAQNMARSSWLLPGDPLRRLRQLEIDTIGSPEWLGQFDPISRVDTAPEFLEELKEAGDKAAHEWLQRSGL
jgi:NTE family protein